MFSFYFFKRDDTLEGVGGFMTLGSGVDLYRSWVSGGWSLD